MPANVAVRLGVEGKADVTAAHKEVGDTGQQAFDGIAASADKATAATDATSAAAERQAAKWARVAALARDAQAAQQSQTAFNAVLGVNPTSGLGNAAVSAKVFDDAARAEEALAAKTAALRAEIDPLGAAQLRLNAAVATANELFGAGKITAAEQAAAVALAQKSFAEAEKGARALGGGVAFSSVQLQELGAVVHRSIDSVAAGANPLRIMTTEGARLGVALGSGPSGVAGVLKLLTSPLALFIGGAVAAAGVVAVLVAVEQRYEAEERKLADAIRGTGAASGATVGQLEIYSQRVAKADDLTSSAARGIVGSLASIGTVSAAQIPKAADLVTHFADFFHQDFTTASAELAKAFADPAKGAADLETRLHLLTAAQVKTVEEFAQQGDRAGALDALMAGLNQTVGTSSQHLHGLQKDVHELHVEFDGASDAVGDFIRKLVGLPSADVAKNLQESIKQYADTQKNPFASLLGLDDAAKKKVIDAATDLGADVARRAKATLSQQSQDLQGAANLLDPQAAQIQQRVGAIAILQRALDDTSGKLLAADKLTRAEAEADIAEGEKEIKKLKERSEMHDKHAETLARESAAMVANAAAAVTVAQAYLQSDAAGERAEATRKALTDATKKGIDAEAQARRQLAVTIGDVAVQGAKAVSDLEGRDAAQRSVNDQVAAGLLTSTQAGQQLQIELQLRPLVAASLLAEGGQRAVLTAEIARQRAALQGLNADQATARLQGGSAAADDRIDQLQLESKYADDLTGARERLLAVLKLEQSPDFQTSTDDRAKAVAIINAIAAANQELETKRAQYAASALRDEQNGYAMQRLEFDLVGKTTDERDAEIARLQRIQALKAQGIDLSSAEAQAILRQGDALDAMAARVRAANDNWTELKSAGDKFVDDVLNPSNWTSWEQVGRTAILDISNELLKLGAINPLKNLLFGESLPTLGGVGGLIGKLFGGGGAASAGAGFVSDLGTVALGLPGFAGGTDYAPGGWARVDEEGGEIINLPRGSQVIPADQTRKLVSQAAGGGGWTLNMPITLNAQGSGPREVDELKAQVQELKRSLPGRIVATMNEARSRSQAA